MSDTDTVHTQSDPPAESRPTDAPDADRESTSRDVRRYLNYAVLAGLVLLALVAGLRFYLAAGATIDRWVADEYRSLFHAAFNLAVLLLAALGVSVQLRRLR